MNSNSITISSLVGGAIVGGATLVATRSPWAAMGGTAAGLAAGGVGAWAAGRNMDTWHSGNRSITNPTLILPLGIGAGIGGLIGNGLRRASSYAPYTRSDVGFAVIAAALGAGILSTVTNVIAGNINDDDMPAPADRLTPH